MTIHEMIKTAHAAQHDAGSFEHFYKEVRKCYNEPVTYGTDPVAVFFAAILARPMDVRVEDMEFYFGELVRAVNAIKKLAPCDN